MDEYAVIGALEIVGFWLECDARDVTRCRNVQRQCR